MSLTDKEAASALLERAIALAATMHAGQVDKAGAPYILHPLRVMLACAPENRVAAVLHDVIEDCPAWTPERFRDNGFPPEIVDALIALTRLDGESYTAFIERVKLNPMARAVKIADLIDNSDLSRIANPQKIDLARAAKYAKALRQIA